jgi:hypothetical protein
MLKTVKNNLRCASKVSGGPALDLRRNERHVWFIVPQRMQIACVPIEMRSH